MSVQVRLNPLDQCILALRLGTLTLNYILRIGNSLIRTLLTCYFCPSKVDKKLIVSGLHIILYVSPAPEGK